MFMRYYIHTYEKGEAAAKRLEKLIKPSRARSLLHLPT